MVQKQFGVWQHEAPAMDGLRNARRPRGHNRDGKGRQPQDAVWGCMWYVLFHKEKPLLWHADASSDLLGPLQMMSLDLKDRGVRSLDLLGQPEILPTTRKTSYLYWQHLLFERVV